MGERDPPGTEADEPLWGGRFDTAPAPEAAALSRSLSIDIRLAPQDIESSVAHVRALEDARLLSSGEAAALEKALREVGEEIAAGGFSFHPADEDVHSAIERAVTERLGDVGAKLHAGRSRNDLVVTDLRLWLLAAARRIDADTVLLMRALITSASDHADTVMPGTTHGRAAQPVTLGHHLLAHAWALLRDLDRLDQWAARSSVSALGAGALATSMLGLDPVTTAGRLGLDRAFANSIDAVSDRDFVQEFVADAAIRGTARRPGPAPLPGPSADRRDAEPTRRRGPFAPIARTRRVAPPRAARGRVAPRSRPVGAGPVDARWARAGERAGAGPGDRGRARVPEPGCADIVEVSVGTKPHPTLGRRPPRSPSRCRRYT